MLNEDYLHSIIMDVKKKHKKKNKKRIHCTYMLSSQWKMRTVYRARSICFVYVSHERFSSLFRNGKWSPPFFSFFLFLFSVNPFPPLRAPFTRAFFLCFPHGFFPFLFIHASTSTDDTSFVRARIRWRSRSSRRPPAGSKPAGKRCTKRHPGDHSNGLYVMDFGARARVINHLADMTEGLYMFCIV